MARHDGRIITDCGREELNHARLRDKAGLAICRIDSLAFRTTFDPRSGDGRLTMSLSLFPMRQAAHVVAVSRLV